MRLGKKMILAFAVIALVCSANVVSAGNPLEKLGRGIANVAFGPLELLIQPYDVNNNMGSIPALTYGVLNGVAYTIAREAVGVVDIVTFLIPLPGCSDDPMGSGYGYGPLMRPAWVIDSNHNAFNFFYSDQAIMNQ